MAIADLQALFKNALVKRQNASHKRIALRPEYYNLRNVTVIAAPLRFILARKLLHDQ
jgi:hypothetical protein